MENIIIFLLGCIAFVFIRGCEKLQDYLVHKHFVRELEREAKEAL